MVHVILAAAVAVLTTSFTSADRGRDQRAPEGRSAAEALVTSHPTLRQSLERLWMGSGSWRAAIDELAARGQRVVLLTPDQVVVRTTAGRTPHRPFEHDLLAEVSPVVEGDGRIRQVLVVVNVPLLTRVYAERQALPVELDQDIDRVVSHEVYGHAIPYLQAGDLSGHCADPKPGQRAVDACAIRRENIIRAELGLGHRTDGGVHSLALTRRDRH